MIEVRVPDEQEGTKAVVRAWLKQVGDAVAENDPLVELETDKVTQEVPAPAAGVLAEIVLDTDAEAVPGALLARIETDGSLLRRQEPRGRSRSAPGVATRRERAGPLPSLRGNDDETRLSPSVRRACLQNGIDPVASARHRPQWPGDSRRRRPGRRFGDRRQRRRTLDRAAAAILSRRTSRTTGCG